MSERDKPWMIDLRDYLGPVSMVGNRREHGEYTIASLEDQDLAEWELLETPERTDIEIRFKNKMFLAVLDTSNDQVIGGYGIYGPYVRPEYRGRGICSEIHYQLDMRNQRMDAAAYTMAGFMTRVATHRLHVERALARGDVVPSGVLARYDVDASGRARLRAPYKAEAHNQWADEFHSERRRLKYEARTDGYTARFLPMSPNPGRDFIHFEPDRDGYALAILMHREAECGFHCMVVNGKTVVQAIRGSEIIDCDGIRPAEIALEDLIRRDTFTKPGFFFEREEVDPDKVEVRIIRDEKTLLDWLKPGDPFSPGHRMSELTEALLEEARSSVPGRLALEEMRQRSPEHVPEPAI